MPDHGRRALHRVCDSVSGVNWRPTRFVDELMLTRYACCVCHVIPSTTVVLPCCHAICEQCQRGSVVQDGGSVCPLDREPFCEDECQKQQLPERKKQNLKAYCWNQEHGCEYVGTLQDILAHCEDECAFHAVSCPRCRENILHADLPAHYMAGCGGGDGESSTETQESSEQDGEFNSREEGFSLEDLKAFLMELEVLDTDSPEQS
ncbi:TNF receptor-associated factor 5-like isoform X3 [Dermacentor variabilis]|uniref:TNF receptor-associated factor 5-like isoform X3 n=1 Tax=Dermacentor variabilis TaxID=34621 RepID=UPI003F5C8D23